MPFDSHLDIRTLESMKRLFESHLRVAFEVSRLPFDGRQQLSRSSIQTFCRQQALHLFARQHGKDATPARPYSTRLAQWLQRLNALATSPMCRPSEDRSLLERGENR